MRLLSLFLSFVLLFFLLAGQSVAKDVVLKASEINKMIVGRTMTVTEEPDKKTGEQKTYQAYISGDGLIRAVHPDGASENYNWKVSDIGAFCVQNNIRLSVRERPVCGYIVSDQSGTYGMYLAKGVKTKDDRVVHARKSELVLTLSNLKKGNQL